MTVLTKTVNIPGPISRDMTVLTIRVITRVLNTGFSKLRVLNTGFSKTETILRNGSQTRLEMNVLSIPLLVINPCLVINQCLSLANTVSGLNVETKRSLVNRTVPQRQCGDTWYSGSGHLRTRGTGCGGTRGNGCTDTVRPQWVPRGTGPGPKLSLKS